VHRESEHAERKPGGGWGGTPMPRSERNSSRRREWEKPCERLKYELQDMKSEKEGISARTAQKRKTEGVEG